MSRAGRGRVRRPRHLAQAARPGYTGQSDALHEQEWIARHQAVPL